MKEQFEVGDRVRYGGESESLTFTGTVIHKTLAGLLHVDRDDGKEGSGVDGSFTVYDNAPRLSKLPRAPQEPQRFAPGTRVKITFDDDPGFVVGEVAFELTADGEQQVVIDEEASQVYTSGCGMGGKAWVLYKEEEGYNHIEVLPPKEKPASVVKGFDEPFEDDNDDNEDPDLKCLADMANNAQELSWALLRLRSAHCELLAARNAVEEALQDFYDSVTNDA